VPPRFSQSIYKIITNERRRSGQVTLAPRWSWILQILQDRSLPLVVRVVSLKIYYHSDRSEGLRGL
jgi:hypothetical protein